MTENDGRSGEGFKQRGPVWPSDDLPDLDNCIIMDRYGPIDVALRVFVTKAKTRPSWADAWEHSTRGRGIDDPLDAQASPEERLAVFQQIKASGDLPAAAGFYLVADEAHFLTDCVLDEEGTDDEPVGETLSEDVDLDESWPWGEACAVRQQNPAEWDRVYLDLLLKSGEDEIARLYIQDRKRFRELLKEGEDFFRLRNYLPLRES